MEERFAAGQHDALHAQPADAIHVPLELVQADLALVGVGLPDVAHHAAAVARTVNRQRENRQRLKLPAPASQSAAAGFGDGDHYASISSPGSPSASRDTRARYPSRQQPSRTVHTRTGMTARRAPEKLRQVPDRRRGPHRRAWSDERHCAMPTTRDSKGSRATRLKIARSAGKPGCSRPARGRCNIVAACVVTAPHERFCADLSRGVRARATRRAGRLPRSDASRCLSPAALPRQSDARQPCGQTESDWTSGTTQTTRQRASTRSV